MKKMPKNDSYASGEYPEDFCIRVRTPFSLWDTEFSFFASCDIGYSLLFCFSRACTVGRAQPSLSEVLGIGYSSKKHFSQSCPEPSIYHLLTVTGVETLYSVSTPHLIHLSLSIINKSQMSGEQKYCDSFSSVLLSTQQFRRNCLDSQNLHCSAICT